MLAQFAPAASPPGAACDRPATGSADTIPVAIVGNHVYVPVCVAGTSQTFILDTGSGQSFIDLDLADSLKLPLGSRFGIGGAGAGRTAAAPLTSSFDVQVASVRVGIRTALRMGELAAYERPGTAGLLGHNFIAQRVLEIDYYHSRLVLHDRAAFRYTGQGARVPIHFVRGFPEFTATIELADGGRVSAECVADVGSGGALSLTRPFVAQHHLLTRVGPTIYRVAGRGAGGATTAHQGRVAALIVGRARVSNVIVGLHDDTAGVMSTSDAFEANIGGDIMRRFTVTFDYGHMQMMWDPNPDVAEPFEADMSGLSFKLDSAGTGFVVTDVMAGGPAEQAGIATGDVITRVDDAPATWQGMDPLRRRFKRDGETVVLTVRRDGAERVVTLVTRRLV